MHKRANIAVIALVLCWSLLQANMRALGQGHGNSAFLLEIRGTVDLTIGSLARKARLRPGVDSHMALQQGDTVKCGANGSATLEINGLPRIISANHSLQIHFKSAPTEAQKAAFRALTDRGYEGGSRGVGSPLWSPPRNGVVRPSTANFGWNISSGSLELSLSDDGGKNLWSAERIDSQGGGLAGAQLESFRLALLQSQLPTAPARLTATIHSELANYQTTFDVMSKAAENKLNDQLSAADEELADPVLRLASKGELLIESAVFAEAKLMFERALVLDPSSERLLTAASSANERTGDLVRADELRAKLSKSAR